MNTRFLKLASVCWALFFVPFLAPVQAQVNYWSAPEESRSVIGANDLLPDLPAFEKGQRVQLDLEGFIQQSRKASKEGSGSISTSTAVWLPLPDGSFERFRLLESPLMEPGLAAEFPEIKSYIIKGIDDPYCTGRMTVSPDLFNAYFSSLANEREVFVRRVSKTDNSQYVSFRAEDDPVFSESFICHWEPEAESEDQESDAMMRMSNNPYVAGSELKVFRMSMTVIGELAVAQGWTTEAQALAGVLTQLDVVNTVYERDLSVRFILPENNDLLLFLDPVTDPFLLENGDQNLRDNHMITEQYLGIENFDVGLVLLYQGNCCGASRGICDDDSKGMNMSAFNSLKVLCHEIGHQFDARHTWAYCNTQGEFEAHEPGSGSTIMGYSTTCGDDYVVPFISNLFFSVGSIEQMNEYMVDRTCNEVLPTNNTPPTVTVPSGGFYIPKSTPFELTGSGSDAENNDLTYLWEQFNRKGIDWTTAGPLADPPVGDVPIFRNFHPSSSPSRVFPRLPNILSNTSVNTEKLPTYSRNLKFRLTVRDNNAGAGGTNSAEVSFEVDGTAGPFEVTAPNTCVTWTAGSTQTVTWEVANTGAGTLVDCQNVKISLSVDGGYTYNYVLAASTPNDGSHAITLPSGVCSKQARIKVEAEGNIFFDITNEDFVISDGGLNATIPQAIFLDGDDDYAEIANTTLGNFGTSDFTIEMWVKTDANGNNPLVNKREVCSTGKSWMFYLEDGIVKGEFRDDPGGVSSLGITGVASINDGVWHHLAITRAGTSVRIYIDGQLDNTNTAGGVHDFTNAANMAIGFVPICGGGRFKGQLDEIKIWSEERTQMQIDDNKDCASTGSENNLEAYYPMDELSCNGCSIGNSLVDKTANANDGTLLNGAVYGMSLLEVQLECSICTAGNISITSQPASNTYSAGATATFSVAATGGVIFYQWERSTDGGVSFEAVSGATSDSYSFEVLRNHAGDQYRCVMVNGCDVVTSSAATLTLNCTTPTIGSITGPTAPCQDNHYTYYVTVDDDVETWHWTLPTGWELIRDGALIFVKAGSGSGDISVYGTDYCGNNTATQTLTVNPVLVEITTQPNSQTINEGDPVDFTVAVSSGGGTTDFRWQHSLDGGQTYTDINGGNAATFAITSATVGFDDRRYRCIVSNDCLYDTSAVATLNISCATSAPLQPNSIIGTNIVCSGSTTTYLVDPVPGADSYTWTLPSGWSGSSTTNSISVTTGTNGGIVRVQAVNGCGTSEERILEVAVNNVTCGRSVHFDGVDDYLEVAQNGNHLTGDLTVSLWLNPEVLTGDSQEDYEGQSLLYNGREFMIRLRPDGDIWFQHGGNTYGDQYFIELPANIKTHIWQHLTITRNAATSEITCYVDGTAVGSIALSDTDPTPNLDHPMTIGAGILGQFQFFRGRMDEIKIWSELRTPSQIEEDMYCSSAGTEPNLVAYYDFETGAVNGDNTALTELPNMVSGTYSGAVPYELALSGPSSNITDGSKGNGAVDGPGLVCAGGGTVEYTVDFPGNPTVTWDLPTGWTGSSTTETISVTPGANAGVVSATAVLSCGNVTLEKAVSTTPVYSNDIVADGVAIDLDGDNDYLQAPSDIYFDGDFTIEAWVYPKAHNNWQRLVDFGNGADNNNIYLALSNGTSGRPRISIRDGSSAFDLDAGPGNELPLNEWSHVAATLEGTALKLYINGIEVAQGTTTQLPQNITRKKCFIGRSNWANDDYANVVIDELRIWSEARSVAQLEDHLFCPIDCAPPSLRLYLPFEDGIAGGNNSAIFSSADYSANGDQAEINGMNLIGVNSNFIDGVPKPDMEGPTIVCDGVEVTYSIDMPGTPTVAWTIPAGWSGSSTTESITVTAGANGGTITADATLACGTVLGFNKTVSTTPPLSNTTLFDGIAMDFGGTDDYILTSPSATYNNSSMTIEAWINTTSTDGSRSIVNYGAPSGNSDMVEFRVWNGRLQFGIFDGNWQNVLSNAYVNTGEWTHVAVVKNGNSVELYINGSLDNSGTIDQSPTISIQTVGHAWQNGQLASSIYDFDGQIDEVRIWNVARTAQEIQDLMNCPIECAPPQLQFYLPFEDGTPGGSSQGTTADYSIYSFPADLTNFDFNTSPVSSNFTDGMPLPAMTGPASAQVGETGLTYTIDLPGSPTINWSLPPGWTGSSTSESITVTAGAVGGLISATVNGCVTTIEQTVTIEKPFFDGVAMDFDGTDDEIRVSNPTFGNFGTGDFTVEMWVKTTDTWSGLINKYQDSSTPRWDVYLNGSGNLRIQILNANIIEGTTAVNDGAWHHLAVTRSGTSVSLYVDGELDGSGTSSEDLTNTADIVIGNRASTGASGSEFAGQIDELRVWDVARTQQEIKDNLFCPITSVPSSVQFYLAFEDGEPAGDNTGKTTTADFSTYVHTASLSGFALNNAASNFVPGVTTPEFTGVFIVCPGVSSVDYAFDLPGDGMYDIDWTLPSGWTGSSTTESITATPGANGGNLIAAVAGSSCAFSIDSTIVTSPPVSNSLVEGGVSLDFDGVDDHLVAPSGVYFDSDFTIETWVYVNNQVDDAPVLNFAQANNDERIVLGLSNGNSGVPFLIIENGATAELTAAPSAIPLNEWVHIAATSSVGTVKIYINGVEVESNPTGLSAPSVFRNSCLIGKSNDPMIGNADAKFDELRIWSVARTAQDIQENLYCPISCPLPELEFYLPFEEGAGDNDNSGFSEATDYSAYLRNPAFQNFALTGTASNYTSGMESTAEISGAKNLCPGETNYTFTVDFPGSPDVAWTLPAGWSGSSTTETIDVTTGTAGGTITASVVQSCGNTVTVSKVVGNAPALINNDFFGGVALDLDGVNDKVEVSDNSVGNFGTGDFTVEFWVNTTDSYGGVVMKHQSGAYLDIFVDSSKVRYQDGQLNLDGNIVVSDGQWHHVAVSRSGTTVAIYVDGVLDISNTSSQNISNNGQLKFGNRDGRDPNADFDGQLDEIRLWSVARTQQEIEEFMYCPLGCAPADVLLYLPFEDGTPGGSSQTTTADYSSYGYTANLNNFDYNATSSNFVDGLAVPEVSGPALVCPGTVSASYTFDMPGEPTVDWALPSGWVITAGADTKNITVTPSASLGTVTATVTESCTIFDDLTVTDTPPLSNSTFFDGVALDFDGNSDYVELENTTTGNFGTGDFTVELWVNTTDSYGGLIGKLNGCGSNWEILLRFGTGKIDFNPPNDAVIQGDIAVNDGNWHHVAVVRTGTTVNIYVDGELDISGTSDDDMVNSAPLTLGTRVNCDSNPIKFFDGSMDEVRIWTIARTQQEIKDFMSCAIPCPPSDLALYLPFEDGTANGNNSKATADYSVYGHAANLIDFDLTSPNATSNFTDGMAAPSITGTTSTCEGTTGLVYSIDLPGMQDVSWSLPMGWAITAGAGTESITVTAGSGSGNITATLGCGTSSFDLAVTSSSNTYYHDADGDGFGDPNDALSTCSPPADYVTDNTDCDDNDADEFPGQAWYADTDGDGYGDANASQVSCEQPVGHVLDNTDCDDTDININPGATEICNGVDDNCDGNIDEGCGPEINLLGQGISIANGDNTPDTDDDTDFGLVSTSGSDTHTFTIENTGSDNLNISSISIGNTTDFAVTQAASSTVAASSSTTFTVAFNPQTTGAKTTTVTINNDDADEDPYTFDVQGTGGESGAALNFAGGPDRVNLGDLGAVTDWTIETWFKPNGENNYENIFHSVDLGVNNGIRLEISENWSEGHLYVSIEGVPYTIVPQSSTLSNNWQHLAIVGDKTNNKVYVYLDGQKVVDAVHTNWPTTFPDFVLGRGFSGGDERDFTGSLDEFRIWNTTRSCAEIEHFKDCELSGSEPGLVAYYQFNQGIADGDNTSISSLAATTGPNGTLNGFTLSGSTSNFTASGGVVSGSSCTGTPAALTTYYLDADGDIYGDPAVAVQDCTQPAGYVTNDADCDDTDGSINPDATEVCNGIDDNCDGDIDGHGVLAIKGASTVCHQLDWTYSVDVPTATAYAWTLPSGWTGTSTTSSISVTPQPSSSGTIQCVATTPCGDITLTIDVSAKDDCDTGLDFDGTDDYVDLPDGVYFDGDFTIESWVYPKAFNSNPRIVGFGNGPFADIVSLVMSDGTSGQPILVVSNGGSVQTVLSPVALPLNQWSHLAATLQGSVAKIFIDGELVVEGSMTVPPTNVTRTNCFVGRSNWSGDDYLNAKIDELRIWNVARTQQEIQDQLFCQMTMPPPSLEVYLPFENGQLAGTNTGTTTTPDFSGNGNEGTLFNFALTGNSSNFEADPDITRYLDSDADGYGDLAMSATDFCLSSDYVMVAGDCDDTNEEVHPHANDKCGNSIDDNCNGITDETRLVLEFDDDVDHDVVNFGNSLGNFGTGDFTVEVRFKTTDPYAALLVKRGICGHDNFWSLHLDNGLPYFDMGENTGGLHYGGMNGTVSVNDGEWHHIAVTRSGTNLRMYVDGQIIDFGKSAADISNTYDLKIGDTPCTTFNPLQLNGEIDEVRIWSVARNYHELSAFANASLSGTEADLTTYHDFNNQNAMGGGTNTGQTISEDRTTNDFDGTLVDFTLDGSTSNWLEQKALLNLSAFLQGPYNTSTGLMNDQLRANSLIPLGEPYTDLNYTYTGHSGGQTIPQSVLDVTGNDAIVDWVVLEIRDKNSPAVVEYAEPVLLQRDGDIVDLDGMSYVEVCEVFDDDYFTVVKHRNHFGVTSSSALPVDARFIGTNDFSADMASAWDDPDNSSNDPMILLETGVYGCYNGNVNFDSFLNVVDFFITRSGTNPSQTGQYESEDVNLDGVLNVVDFFRARSASNPTKVNHIPD